MVKVVKYRPEGTRKLYDVQILKLFKHAKGCFKGLIMTGPDAGKVFIGKITRIITGEVA